ncbi:MAG: 3-dehydroquinate synthase II [Lentisphaerae bacterium]|nr:3-dehydroquinate synthase II [Lentisphaerota bacterium]
MKKAWVRVIPWDKELAISAIESGADAIIVAKGDSEKAKELGRIRTVSEDGDIKLGKDAIEFNIATKDDEEKAATTNLSATLILQMSNWTIIPIENLIAQRDKIMAEVTSKEQAQTMLGILEKGVDGVVLTTDDHSVIREVVQMVRGVSAPVKLQAAKITRIETAAMGDRVCIDTCTKMTPGQGMLVGNTSSAFFLVHAETLENPYVAARPFRVNASAVHAYLMMPNNKTAYLSDLRIGSEVLLVDHTGKTGIATIGRCKIEKRPMLMVFAEVDGIEISVCLQNAETINLVKPGGEAISVSSLKPGIEIMVYLESGGRHFGMKIEGTIDEK